MDSQRTGPRLIEVDSEDALQAELAAAGLAGGWPVLVVVGGAAGLSEAAEALARRVVEELAVPVALDHAAAIVDGGTDSGVMRLVGHAHAGRPGRPPLVGVAVQSLVRVPGRDVADLSADAADAEPHHTHLVLVPGRDWGDESPWLSAVAGRLSAGRGALTLVLNGGTVTLSDVAYSVAARRPVVVVAGTGRSSDLLAAALDGDLPEDSDARAVRSIVSYGLLSVLDPTRPPGDQQTQLTRLLSR
jgi:hypothetical protein